MGMFDSVFADCPKCGEVDGLEWQTKVGPCQLNRYSALSVPTLAASAVADESTRCKSCNREFEIKLPMHLSRVHMTVVPVRSAFSSDYD